jgi:hypothetical protein
MDCAQSAPTAVPGSITAFRYLDLHFSAHKKMRLVKIIILGSIPSQLVDLHFSVSKRKMRSVQILGLTLLCKKEKNERSNRNNSGFDSQPAGTSSIKAFRYLDFHFSANKKKMRAVIQIILGSIPRQLVPVPSKNISWDRLALHGFYSPYL